MTYDKTANLNELKFARTGYTFKEWNTKKDGKGTGYADGASVMNLSTANKGKVTLYAIWTANTYTINFISDFGIGSMPPQTIAYDKSVKLDANAFHYPGYSFAYWTGSNGKIYKDKVSVKNLCNEQGDSITLKAYWTINTYTVKFNANGGTGIAPIPVAGEGDAVKVLIPDNPFVFSGYTFKQWNTSKDGTGTPYSPGQQIVFDTKNKAVVTLYAIWNYKATFNPGLGSGTPFVKNDLVYNQVQTVLGMPFSRPGYYLVGWNNNELAAAKGTIQYKTSGIKNVGPDAVLYAVWKQVV